MKPLFIFDLDGTLALTGHRQHMLDDKEDPDRWMNFFLACDKDLPNHPVIDTLDRLHFHGGADFLIWSGRSDIVRDKTVKWLADHLTDGSNNDFNTSFIHARLTMRKHSDHTPDEELKLSWLRALHPHDRARLVAIFDDREKVVKMWRENGIACFQVAKGDF